jgi:hypothetical protein
VDWNWDWDWDSAERCSLLLGREVARGIEEISRWAASAWGVGGGLVLVLEAVVVVVVVVAVVAGGDGVEVNERREAHFERAAGSTGQDEVGAEESAGCGMAAVVRCGDGGEVAGGCRPGLGVHERFGRELRDRWDA